jgi:protein-tyrosine phosphatase
VIDGRTSGITDLHSHLVPGVDDGSPTLDDALEGVDRLVALGVTTIVTTPHVDASLSLAPDAFEEYVWRVAEGTRELRQALARRVPELRLEQAFEVKLDLPQADLSDLRLRYPGTDRMLVEWPGLQLPPGTTRALEGLVAAGVQPVVAHPERYRGLERRMELAEAWRAAGAILLVNHGSLVGRYGNEARRCAELLLARGWVDALATDFHGRPRLPLYLDAAERWFRERGAEGAWSALAVVNPTRILAGEALEPVPPVTEAGGLMAWARRAFGGRSEP